MEMLLYFCCIELLLCFLSHSLSTLLLSCADWTVSSGSRSHCDDPYLTFCLFFHIYCSLIPFLSGVFTPIPFFLLPLPSISVSVCSTFISVQHVPPPPFSFGFILTCPSYPQILSVCLPLIYQRIHAYMWLCFSVSFWWYMYVLVCKFIRCISGCVFPVAPAGWKSDNDKALQITHRLCAVAAIDVMRLFAVLHTALCLPPNPIWFS